MTPYYHLLVVDDDSRLRDLLKKYLIDQGFLVSVASHYDEAQTLMELFLFDAIILDVMMPNITGFDGIQHIRSHPNPHVQATPVLFLTAMGEVHNRIQGFEHGADDYLVKPFDPQELTLRLKSLLKRSHPINSTITGLRFGPFIFEEATRCLYKNGDLIPLTSVESSLLNILGNCMPNACSRDTLSDAVGGTLSERSVDVHITRLRKKIEDTPKYPRYIQTVRHQGYALIP